MPKAQRKSGPSAPESAATSSSGQLTISALKEGQTYSKKLKVKVVKHLPSAPGQSSLTTILLADSTGWIRALVPANHPKFVEGTSLFIRKFYIKEKRLRVYEPERETFFGSALDVPENILLDCMLHHNEPVHGFLHIKAIKERSMKETTTNNIVSFRGTVISNKHPRAAFVKGTEVPVKEIQVEDSTDKIYLSLWRESSTSQLEVGDEVEARDVTVSFSTFHQEIAANANVLGQIQLDQEPRQCQLSIWGLQSTSLQEKITILVEEEGNDKELCISLPILLKAVNGTDETTFEELVSVLPVTVKVQRKGKYIVHLM